ATNISGDVVLWTEGDAPVHLDSAGDALIADVDSADFDGGSLTVAITSAFVAGEDSLILDGAVVTLSDGLTIGSAVTVDGAAIGAITAAADDSITIAFSSNATTARVEMLVHAFEYANAGGADPTAGDRTIGWTLVDGDGITGGGSDTASFTTTVSVASVNSAPVLAGLDLLAIAFEGDVPVAIDPCVDFSDAEGNFNGGTLVVSGVIAEDRIGIDNVG